jgi:hypothetical protein
MKRYKQFCSDRGVAPEGAFHRYDTGGTQALNGVIPTMKVQAAFYCAQFPVQPSARDPRSAVVKDPRSNQFNYLSFARAVNAEDTGASDMRSSTTTLPLTRELEQTVQETLGQIREKLIARRWDISRAFRGLSCPTINAREFQDRLASVNLVLVTAQIQALLRKYRVNLSDEVDWKTFVEDVQRSRTVGL